MNFRTVITGSDVSIYNIASQIAELANAKEGSDFDIDEANFTVRWALDMDTRDWGVKDIAWYVTEVIGAFMLVRYDANGDKTNRQRFAFTSKDFKIHTDFEMTEHHEISCSEIEINFKDKTINVR